MRAIAVWRFFAGGCVLALALAATVSAEVTIYPSYPNESASNQFSITADGRQVFVHNSEDFHAIDYARFAFTGTVNVTVTLKSGTTDSCSIVPTAYAIGFTRTSTSVSFTLAQPRKLVLYFAGRKELALFTEAPEVNPPKLGDANVKNIMDYAIDATGATVQTIKINAAISELSGLGGTRILYFPRGVYLAGTIMMQSNVTLYLAPDALITAADLAAEHWPRLPRLGFGGGAFVFFNSIRNAGILGRGTINARGLRRKQAGQNGNWDIQSIKMHRSTNLNFDGPLLIDGWTWAWHPVGCDSLTARNMKIISQKDGWWSDGFEPDVCSDVLVDDCFFWGSDDGLAVKGTESTLSNRPVERITFRNCVVSTNANGLRYGYPGEARWAYGKNIVCDNIQFINYGADAFGIGIKLDCVDAPSDSFRILNCSFERGPGYPNTMLFGVYGSNVGNILLENLVSYRTQDSWFDIKTGNIKIHCMNLNGTKINSREQAIAAGVGSSNNQITVFPCNPTSIAIEKPVERRLDALHRGLAMAQAHGGVTLRRMSGNQLVVQVEADGTHAVEVLTLQGSTVKAFRGTGPRNYTLALRALSNGTWLVRTRLNGVVQTRIIALD